MVQWFAGSMDQWTDGPMNVRIVHLGLHDVQCIH